MVKVTYEPSLESAYLDAKLIQYRKHRPEKTSGNPYYVLGEPIGDLRDNMGCKNIDYTTNILIQEQTINTILFRTYQTEVNDDNPIVFFIHGGAFIGGSIETVENPCKLLAQESNALVVNIDYRLAPEVAYPDNIEDCMSVINELYNNSQYHFNRQKMFISGDSAGGNLALACLQKDYAQTNQKRFLGAILYYPVVDLTMKQEFWKWDIKLYRGYEDELVKNCLMSLYGGENLMNKLYVQNKTNLENPLISPLYMKDFTILPDMLIIYAEYDYLRLQIEAFVKQTNAKGICFEGINHAFLDLLGVVNQSKKSLEYAVQFIKDRVK